MALISHLYASLKSSAQMGQNSCARFHLYHIGQISHYYVKR